MIQINPGGEAVVLLKSQADKVEFSAALPILMVADVPVPLGVCFSRCRTGKSGFKLLLQAAYLAVVRVVMAVIAMVGLAIVFP